MNTDFELTKTYWRDHGENPPPGQKVLDSYAVYRRGRKVTVRRNRLTAEELDAISAGLHEAGEMAFREADSQELVFEILKPFFVTEETKTFEALDMIHELVSKKLQSGGSKSPLQLADEFIAEHYPPKVDARIRTHYMKLFSQRLRPN